MRDGNDDAPDDNQIMDRFGVHHVSGDWAARWPAVVPAMRPNMVPIQPYRQRPGATLLLRNLQAFHFVIQNALAGDVTISLAQGIHGKSINNVILAIELSDPDGAGL